MAKLSHIDEKGAARMVDVSDKAVTARTANAEGFVSMAPETLALLQSGEAPKGDVLGTARIAGIMAAKRTHELIPLCHPLNLTKVVVNLEPSQSPVGVRVTAEVKVTGQTGVEMEALTAVSVACLTLYDMLKAVDRDMSIEGMRVTQKSGGRSGEYPRTARRRTDSAWRLLPVDEALRRILDGAAPLGSESVDLLGAAGRVLAEDVTATLTQPPFDTSAMDGYAVRAADVASIPAALTVIGESNAGGPFAGDGRIRRGGAHLHRRRRPQGADCVVIQEDTERNGDTLSVREAASAWRQHPPGGRRLPSGRHAAARRPAARRLAPSPSPPPPAMPACRFAARRASPSWRRGMSWSSRARNPGRGRSSPPTLTGSRRW